MTGNDKNKMLGKYGTLVTSTYEPDFILAHNPSTWDYTEGVHKQTMADLDCITTKFKYKHKHKFLQCQHICQQIAHKYIQTFTHMNTQWESPAQGIGGRVLTWIYRTLGALHALSLYLCQLRAGGQISQRDTSADWTGARHSLNYGYSSVHKAGITYIFC